MSNVKSVALFSERPWRDGLVKRKYTVTLTDNNLVDHTTIIGPYKVLPSHDGSVESLSLLEGLKDSELDGIDQVPIYNDSQADYDRRALGQAMLIQDIDDFHQTLPLWLAMQSRSGNNRVQRAATLGVSLANYDLVSDRYRSDQGAASFIDDAKGQVWTELPAEFE